jgi:hypothetical protein
MHTQQRYRCKTQSEIWFEGLGFKNQEVIKWFSNTYGRGLSRQRGWIVTDFHQLHNPDHPIDIPTQDKYDYAYDNFDDFKLYASGRMVPVEGGAA